MLSSWCQLTGSRDHEQVQELGEEGGLLGVETLMFQDQGKPNLVHQKLLGSAQMETLHFLKNRQQISIGEKCQTSGHYCFHTYSTYQYDW